MWLKCFFSCISNFCLYGRWMVSIWLFLKSCNLSGGFQNLLSEWWLCTAAGKSDGSLSKHFFDNQHSSACMSWQNNHRTLFELLTNGAKPYVFVLWALYSLLSLRCFRGCGRSLNIARLDFVLHVIVVHPTVSMTMEKLKNTTARDCC